MAERWLPVIGFEEHYVVSDHGNVKRVAPGQRTQVGRVLKPQKLPSSGHRWVTLSIYGVKSYRFVHRLVMESFVGPRPNRYDINHEDGNPSNNRLSNLKYMTHADNIRHAVEVLGRNMGRRGEDHHSAKLTEKKVKLIRKLQKEKRVSLMQLAVLIGVTKMTISDIVHRRTWKHIK